MGEFPGNGPVAARGDGESIRAHVKKLRRRLAARAQQARDDLAQTSTVPMDALDLDDPMLEAALTDSAMQFFIKHMTAFDNDGESIEAEVEPRQETFDVQVLQDTMAKIREIQAAPAPSLMDNLASERFWILIDLVTKGDSLSKQRATVEIREFMKNAREEHADALPLEEVLGALRKLTDRPLILDILTQSLHDELERRGSTPPR